MLKAPAALKDKKVALQFRAGKMTLANGTVTADPRKGMLAFLPHPTGVTEIMWCPLDDSEPDTYCIFPRTATVSRVTKCTTGRVMLIDIQDRQLFFWLQDRSDDKDEATFKKAQQLLIPPKSQAAPATAPTAAAVSAPTAAATAAPRTTASGSSISVQALQNILADLTAGQGQRVSLQALLGSDALLAALNEDRAFYTARLEEHLPPTQEGNTRDIVDEVRNPQVSATAAMLQAALEDPSGFHEVTTAFGVAGPANASGVAGFLQRLLDDAAKKNAQ